jgi:hypothetical protein
MLRSFNPKYMLFWRVRNIAFRRGIKFCFCGAEPCLPLTPSSVRRRERGGYISLRMRLFSKPILSVDEYKGASASVLLQFALASGRFTVTP